MEIENLKRLNNIQFLNYVRGLNINQIYDLIDNPNLPNLDYNKYNILLFNIDCSQLEHLIENELLYDKIMSIPDKGNNRTILNVLADCDINKLKVLIESEFIVKYRELLIRFIKSIKPDALNGLLTFIDFSNFLKLFDDKVILYDYIYKNIGSIDEDIINLFYNKLQNNDLKLIRLFKVSNYKEFILYVKFGVLLEVNVNLPEITLSNGLVILMSKIINCKDSYIKKLMNLLGQKEPTRTDILFITCLKLYYIFGFDNAKKIIEDKFSIINDTSLIRINDFEFKDERREYRFKNQKEFYNYQMIDEIIEGITAGESKVFYNLLYEPTKEKASEVRKVFLNLLSIYAGDELKQKIREKIGQIINIREKLLKEKHFEELKTRHFKNPVINSKILYDLFLGVDLAKVMGYDSETLKSLQEFLLGNAKANNDCLFRLIINENALGLENSISFIINNFNLFNTMLIESGLSKNSILDIIDILKVNLYDLHPNESDISLSSISRLLNSVEFITNSDVDIIKETCKLHIERKHKVYSTIPTVSGKTEYFSYEVAPFDAEYLLTAGLDGKNCFRIAGAGEQFFKYCLTNPNAVIVYLHDLMGNKYICPIIRSGNAISCNGIDPEVPDNLKKEAINALSKCFCDIINISLINEKDSIEVGTISNLHMKDYFSNYSYPVYALDTILPIDERFYTDYNKDEITHYIIAKANSYGENKFYLANSQYYQERMVNYEYDTKEEYDFERITMIVNSIAYTAIDYLDIPDEEKNKRKREYKKLNVLDFKYIIGNKDWYVAIDSQLNIIGNILPFDKRAKEDYIEALKKAPQRLERIIGEDIVGKNREKN